MLLNKKIRTFAITLFLLFSLLSLNFANTLKAENPFEGIDLDVIIDPEENLNPHPFRYVGIWQSNRTMTITDDMTFELYFSAPFLTQIQLLELINYQDTLKIDVYHINEDKIKTPIENGNITITLEPEVSEDYVQKFTVTLKNVEVTVPKNEYLAFVIEIEQSQKPIVNFAEKRFETKFVPRLEKIANILRKTNDTNFQELATVIDMILENLSNNNIGGDEFGDFLNVFFSSAFYYGSADYPSSVTFYNDETEETTVYFQSEYSDLQYDSYITLGEMLPFEKIANETKPTSSDDFAWPPLRTYIEDGFTNIEDLIANIEDLLEKIEGSEYYENTTNTTQETELIYWIIIYAFYVVREINPNINTNIVTYYLEEGGKLTTTKPADSTTNRDELSSKEPLVWSVTDFQRNKILTNATAYLYIHYSKILILGKVVISVSLKKNNDVIATDEQELDRTNIIELIQRGANAATKFTFDIKEDMKEIWYDDNLSIEVSYVKKPLLGLLRPIKINYGSQGYPSKIVLTLKETDNIKIGDLPEKAVYAGGSAHYILNVTSENSEKYKDTVKISVETKEKEGSWNIDFYPKELKIDSGTSQKVHVFVNSTATDYSAYTNKEYIDFFVNATGKTGFYSNTSHVYVSRNAVKYDFEASYHPEDIEIKHGSNKTFTVVIKNNNTGFIADQYILECISKNNFTITTNLTDQETEEINVGDETKVNITIQIPRYTHIDSDEITINIISSESSDDFTKTLKINVKVITPNILESIYRLFESAAAKIGLTFEYAGWVLIAALVILLIIIIILIIYLKKRGFVEIICLERIKEIAPDETAKYEITLKNSYKYDLTYNIESKLENDTQGFDISVDVTELALQSGEERVINLLVKPNDNVKKEDWCEVKITVRPNNKAKTNQISTITTIKNAKTDVRLSGVFHWPKTFNKGDRVETSFKVWNHGNVSTGKINILFFVNGKEKNKVEDVIIPRGGYADIEIPWIADSAKNEVYIVVD